MLDRARASNAAAGLLLLLAAALLLACSSGAPTLVVSGTVTDAATGQPIAGATVSDDGYGPKPVKGAVCDSAGCYRYLTWPEEHNLEARAPGYRSQRRVLTTGPLGQARSRIVDFKLDPE